MFANLSCRIVTIEYGHLHVHQNQVEWFTVVARFVKGIHRLLSVAESLTTEAKLFDETDTACILA